MLAVVLVVVTVSMAGANTRLKHSCVLASVGLFHIQGFHSGALYNPSVEDEEKRLAQLVPQWRVQMLLIFGAMEDAVLKSDGIGDER